MTKAMLISTVYILHLRTTQILARCHNNTNVLIISLTVTKLKESAHSKLKLFLGKKIIIIHEYSYKPMSRNLSKKVNMREKLQTFFQNLMNIFFFVLCFIKLT